MISSGWVVASKGIYYWGIGFGGDVKGEYARGAREKLGLTSADDWVNGGSGVGAGG
jgi:hypothetical protein